jgi:hypothetical protein
MQENQLVGDCYLDIEDAPSCNKVLLIHDNKNQVNEQMDQKLEYFIARLWDTAVLQKTSVLKTAVFIASKHTKVFNTAVFLETMALT